MSSFVFYLQRYLDGPIRVDEVAAHAGLSRAHLQRLCQNRYGCGIATLHQRRRIAAACRHLATRDGSIAACAEHFGFADQAQFSRAFKKLMKMTPTEYRRRHWLVV